MHLIGRNDKQNYGITEFHWWRDHKVQLKPAHSFQFNSRFFLNSRTVSSWWKCLTFHIWLFSWKYFFFFFSFKNIKEWQSLNSSIPNPDRFYFCCCCYNQQTTLNLNFNYKLGDDTEKWFIVCRKGVSSLCAVATHVFSSSPPTIRPFVLFNSLLFFMCISREQEIGKERENNE